MAESRGEFAGALRELRTRARLTQEGLAEAAGLSHRTVSDLERGLATTPQKETVRLLDRPGAGAVRDGSTGPSARGRVGRRRGGNAVTTA